VLRSYYSPGRVASSRTECVIGNKKSSRLEVDELSLRFCRGIQVYLELQNSVHRLVCSEQSAKHEPDVRYACFSLFDSKGNRREAKGRICPSLGRD